VTCSPRNWQGMELSAYKRHFHVRAIYRCDDGLALLELENRDQHGRPRGEWPRGTVLR